MIKNEDLLKYIGKEVFTKKVTSDYVGDYHIAHFEPIKVILAGFSLALKDGVVEADIKIIQKADYYLPPLKNEDLYATEEECRKECLKALNGDILRVKEFLAALEAKRKEWEK
jgi:hypothetical protein